MTLRDAVRVRVDRDEADEIFREDLADELPHAAIPRDDHVVAKLLGLRRWRDRRGRERLVALPNALRDPPAKLR